MRVAAGTARERVRFPAPVGDVDVYHVGHPEPVTLPLAFPDVRRVTLKGGLSERLLSELAVGLGRIGATTTPGGRNAVRVAMRPLLPWLGRIGRPAQPCSAARVDVLGAKDGRAEHVAYGAAATMSALTGVPLALGALWLGRGQIARPGVAAPEACIEPQPFLAELARRGIALYEGESMEKPLAP